MTILDKMNNTRPLTLFQELSVAKGVSVAMK